MRLVAKTGEIQLEGADLQIGPALERSEFLTSATGRASEPVVENPPHRSYDLPDVEAHGARLCLRLYFVDDRLDCVEIQGEDEAEHDRLLCDAWKTPPGEYAWGRVLSGFDRRDGESLIRIAYR